MLTVLSVALMLVDARLDTLKPVRSQLGLVLTPVYWLADLPVRLWQGVTEQFSSHSELLAEDEKLKAEALLLQRRLQENCPHIHIEKTGRGRFRLCVLRPVVLEDA